MRSTPASHHNAGFTLIELLLVVVIIGILASISINRIGNIRHKAAEATLKSDLRRYAAAQEEYAADHNFSYGAFRALERAPYNFQLSAEVRYLENGTDGRTWWLEVTHPSLSATDVVSCRMESSNSASKELGGAPVCDAGY